MADLLISDQNLFSNHSFKKSGRKENLTGMRFGRLLVLRESNQRISGRIAWECICDCGNLKTTLAKTLKNGGTSSCGCFYMESISRNLQNNKKPIGYKRIKKQSGRAYIKTEFGFVAEHRFVAEKKIMRKLKPNEAVHHIDGDKMNNAPENLLVMAHRDHTRMHHTGSKRPSITGLRISKTKQKKSALTVEDVKNIRIKYIPNKVSMAMLANEYGVSKTNIQRIIEHKTWKEVA